MQISICQKKEEIDKYTAPIKSLANVQFDHMRLFWRIKNWHLIRNAGYNKSFHFRTVCMQKSLRKYLLFFTCSDEFCYPSLFIHHFECLCVSVSVCVFSFTFVFTSGVRYFGFGFGFIVSQNNSMLYTIEALWKNKLKWLIVIFSKLYN